MLAALGHFFWKAPFAARMLTSTRNTFFVYGLWHTLERTINGLVQSGPFTMALEPLALLGNLPQLLECKEFFTAIVTCHQFVAETPFQCICSSEAPGLHILLNLRVGVWQEQIQPQCLDSRL